MSSTVQMGSATITSVGESAADVVKALKPQEESKDEPKILVDDGQPVEEEPEKKGLSKAASELGKKGGKATAKARAAAEKDEPEPEPAEKPEPKAARPAEKDEDDLSDLPEGGRARTRVQNAIRAAKAAEERARYESGERARLVAEVERLRASSAPSQPAQQAEPGNGQAQAGPDEEPEPEIDDYALHADWVKAIADHRGRRAGRQEFERLQAEQREIQRLDHEDRVVFSLYGGHKRVMDAAFRDEPDLEGRIHPSLVRLPPSFNMPPGQKAGPANFMKSQLMASKAAPGLYEHFTENPEDWQRIAALADPDLIVREFARLEYRLEDATTGTSPAKREVSQAPNPPKPVRGSPHTESGEPDENASFASFIRANGQRRLRR